jgi:hypothetical protein
MSLGQKLRKTTRTIGRKLKSAERLGRKVARQVDIGARKTSNTLKQVENVLGDTAGYVAGTPLEGVSTIARDLARSGIIASDEVRKGARAIEKKSRREIAEDLARGAQSITRFQ